LAQSFQQETEVEAIGPYLPFVDGVNAFGEGFDRLVPKDRAVRAETKGIHNEFAGTHIEKHDAAGFGLHRAKLLKDGVTCERSILQLSADNGHVQFIFFEQGQRAFGIGCSGRHFEMISLWM
jgi:hypothetical protein